jgi:hypothetical protein
VRRRTVVGLLAFVLLALAGAAVPTTLASAGLIAETGPDQTPPTKDPKPSCHGRDCATEPTVPTPTKTHGGDTDPTDPPAPGASAADPAAPPVSGQAVLGGSASGGSGRPDGAGGQPGGPALVGGGLSVGGNSGTTTTSPRPAAATTPAAGSMPLWPILWGGTALIALVTAGLLIALRDRRIRPDGGRQEPEQGVASPSGPIRMDWTEPPD